MIFTPDSRSSYKWASCMLQTLKFGTLVSETSHMSRRRTRVTDLPGLFTLLRLNSSVQLVIKQSPRQVLWPLRVSLAKILDYMHVPCQ